MVRFVIILLILCMPYKVIAATNEWSYLDQLSDEALRLTKDERYDDVQEVLARFSNNFREITKTDNGFIVESVYKDVLQTLNRSDDSSERVEKMTEFRLVVDAISGVDPPLWLKFEPVLVADTIGMQQALKSKDMILFHTEFNSFLKHYEIIEPSILVNGSKKHYEKIEEEVKILEAASFSVLSDREKEKSVENLEKNIRALFEGDDSSFLWVLGSIGGFIVIILTYVGWRKYSAIKKIFPEREE